MKNFEEIRWQCPWYLADGSCAATKDTEVKCSEAHCAVLFWLELING